MSLPSQPTLATSRLALKPLSLEDAPRVQELAGAAEIAATTASIPHPYPDGAAAEWIATHPGMFENGTGAVFGVFTCDENAALIGCIGLGVDRESQNAELGYWIGLPYWNCGYATEAAHMVVAFGFAYFRLHKIYARCLARNPASARVLEKIGMRREGLRREHLFKSESGFEDLVDYGLLISEWTQLQITHRIP